MYYNYVAQGNNSTNCGTGSEAKKKTNKKTHLFISETWWSKEKDTTRNSPKMNLKPWEY